MKHLWLVSALAGCDKLFDLDRLSQPTRDAAAAIVDSRGGNADAAIDAGTCTNTGHDEDGDYLDDGCDPCPSVATGSDSGNMDGDALPDPCDPRPETPGDKLLKVWFFNDAADYDEFAATNAVHNPSAGLVALDGGATFTTNATFAPRAIELNVTGFFGGGLSAETRIRTNLTCRVLGADCAVGGNMNQGCVFYDGSAMNWPLPASSAHRLAILPAGNGTKCVLASGSTTVDVLSNNSVANSTLAIETTSAGSTSITSIVLYTAP